jgi:hypothetical protein
MNLNEFDNFISSFVDEEFNTKENNLIFNQCIKLKENEIFNSEYLKMYFPEFLEGLCRVVDKLSPIPKDEKIEDWDFERRFNQTLIEKLENIFFILVKNIRHKDFKIMKEKFPTLVRDQFTDLYIIDYENNFFYTKYKMDKKSSWYLL